MPYYATTITRNCRNGFTKDKEAIQGLIDILHEHGYESGHLSWEVQPNSPHLLHVHFVLAGKKMPYIGWYRAYLEANDVYVNHQRLKTVVDLERWTSYCHKHDSDWETTEDRYEESTPVPYNRLI